MTQTITAGPYIGVFSKDDDVGFMFNEADIGGLAITHFDVRDTNDGSLVVTDSTIEDLSGSGGTIAEDLRLPTTPIDLSAAGFERGRTYQIILKTGTGDSPTGWVLAHTFSVSREDEIKAATDLILSTETSDAAAEDSAAVDSLMGRLRTIERNQTDILFPRLKRVLGLLGEHQLVDGFLHDESGNTTECRIRIFDTGDNRDAASIWDDRAEEADPAPAFESGELGRYTVTQSHLLPRNLKTVYQGSISTDADDNDYTDSVI